MNYKKGSEWRKWDLHVHTPSSIIQHYGGNNDETWEKFIVDLEALPTEFKVLGINDYIFIEGYEKLKKEKEENNRLQNIDLLLPVIEFRIEKFAGVDFKNLKRINLHIIFSDEVETEIIKSQFLNTLDQHYILDDGNEWNQAITIQSIEELGKRITESTPVEKRQNFGNNIIVGFNNLNIKEDQIFKVLERDCFKGKYLKAVGKTEWANLPWTDASIATKKTTINKADIIFTASSNKEEFEKAKIKLKDQGVKDLLLDCSDAHYFSSSTEKDKVGNCLTWIKADTTFEGLKQILYEQELRVHIGQDNPTSKNRKICISNINFTNSNAFPIINQSIELNRDMVCIIGGRGSGKSALFESIAYCFDKHKSNSSEKSKLLNSTFNRKRKSFIEYYKNEESANVNIALTYSDKDLNSLEIYNSSLKLRGDICSYPFLYLGQNQIEEFSDNADQIHKIAFDTIIRQTSKSSDLISFKSNIDKKKQELINSNKEIERIRQSISNYDKEKLEEEKRKVESELKLLSSKETKIIIEEFNKSNLKIDDLNKIEELIGEIDINESEIKIGIIQNIINSFEEEISPLLEQSNNLASKLSQNALLITWQDLSDLKEQISKLKSSINKTEIQNNYHKSLNEVEEKLKGNKDISVSYLESMKKGESEIKIKLDKLSKLQSSLLNKELEREGVLNSLHQLYMDYKNSYSSAIKEFNTKNEEILKGIKLEANNYYEIEFLVNELYKLTDGRKSKNFRNFKESWMEVLDDSTFNITSWYKSFIDNVDNQKVFLDFDINQIDSKIFADYNSLETKISYEVEPDVFIPLNQLSLGQKGTVLLKLYLSSGNECPILIDQPEDHLDNEFIYKDLVNTIRNAKVKRQIIIVTHDANLVVNGDAEQVIIATYKDQKINHELSGALENPDIRIAVTRILEGGDEAFKKRELKYQFDK